MTRPRLTGKCPTSGRCYTTRMDRISFAWQFGATVRRTRQHLGWNQRQLADRVGVSQPWVSRIERGTTGSLEFAVVDRLTDELGIRIVLDATPAAVEERRLQRDPAHALTIAYVGRHLARHGWSVQTEVEVGSGRFRGWADVVAFHEETGCLLLVEIKTELRDFGRLVRQVGWYEREAWEAARSLGWRARSLRTAVILLATEANDASVREFREGFAPWAPSGAVALLAMLDDPAKPSSGRFLALVDPLSRRARWLVRTRRDGRRSTLRDGDYAGFMRRRHRRGQPAGMANSRVLARP